MPKQQMTKAVQEHLDGIAKDVRREITENEGSISLVIKRGGPFDELSVEAELNPLTNVVTLVAKKYLDEDGHKKAIKIVLEMDHLPTLDPGDEYTRPELVIGVEPQPLGDDLHRSGGS